MTDRMDPNQREQPFSDERETSPRTDGRDEDELQSQDLYSSGTPGGHVAVTQAAGGGGSPTGLPGQVLASTVAGHDQPVEGRRDQTEDAADLSEDQQSAIGRDADSDEATLGH